MAEIKNSAFEIKVSNHEFESADNITGLFQNASGDAETCAAGFLCVTDALLQNEGYPAGVLNGNTWSMKAAASTVNAGIPVYACNTFGVNELTDATTGEVYKVNANTLGLAIPAGRLGTFTRIDFTGDRIYRFGVGNANAAVGSNKYFTIAAGMLAPASAAPTANGAVYFELLGTGTFTQGAWAAFGYVDVRARHVTVAAAPSG